MRAVVQGAQTKIKEAIAEIDREQSELQSALTGLMGGSRLDGAASPAKTPRKPSGARRRARGGKRAARGRRGEQFLAAVREQPGATVTEIAKKLGVKPTSLYTVAKKLHSEKQITKKGSGYSIKS
jgi:DNA-binding NtrC family response regulator